MSIKTTIKYPLLHIIYFFVGFIPRNRKIWIFGSGNDRFAGNSKWLFLYLYNANKEGIKKIWISRSKKIIKILQAKGLEAYYLKSLKGLYYAVRGGIYIFNVHTNYDIGYFFSNGAKKINLWHGLGVKKMGLDSDLTNNYFYKLYHGNIWQKLKNRFFRPWEYESYDIMTCISELTAKCTRSAFGKRVKDIIITGYPCNDAIFKNIDSPFEEDQKLIDFFKTIKSNQKKIILYMPTFRDIKIYNSESMDIAIDWNKLNSFLTKNNSMFIIKLHPVKQATVQIPASCKNIQTLDSLADVYPILKYVDVLITDYSTVCYDFLLCSRPIIFYWYDVEGYRAKNRSLYEDFENLLMGPRVKNFDALLDILDKCINNKNNFIEENLKTINNCQSVAQRYLDSNSSQRVYEQIINKFL